MEAATVEKIYGTKVWIESSFLGDRRVMRQHDAPGEKPFCYATFHYDHRHTSNTGTMAEATKLALALGATEPVECRRSLPF